MLELNTERFRQTLSSVLFKYSYEEAWLVMDMGVKALRVGEGARSYKRSVRHRA